MRFVAICCVLLCSLAGPVRPATAADRPLDAERAFVVAPPRSMSFAPDVTRTYPGAAPCNTTLQACISASANGDTVNVLANTYITATLNITRAIKLQGAGAASTILQASSGRVISISANITTGVVISGLRVQGGLITSGSTGGAGILAGNNTLLQLVNSDVMSNSATSPGASGGGVLAGGPAFVTNTRIVNNLADFLGGGGWFVYTTTVVGAQFLSNTANSSDGGGANFSRLANVSGTLFARNYSDYAGGGAVFNGATSITNSWFISNTAVSGGGGLYAAMTTTVRGSQFISNAVVGSPPSSFSYGGGAWFDGASDIADTLFRRNTTRNSGGGAYFYGSPTALTYVSNTQFISNSFQGATFNSLALVQNSLFMSNTGGGASFGSAFVTNSLFVGNVISNGYGGGASFVWPAQLTDVGFERNVVEGTFSRAGGAYFLSTTLLSRVYFTANHVLQDNGSIFFGHGGGAYFYEAATVRDSVFISNTASNSGGGIKADRAMTVTGSVFNANRAEQGGGFAIEDPSSIPDVSRLENNLFLNNAATSSMGAQIYFKMPSASAKVLHNTLTNDSLNAGSAIYVERFTAGVTNTIITSHTIGINRAGATGSAREAFNLFFGNTLNLSGTVASGGGSITATPKFVNPTARDFHLQLTSPARNAGTNAGVPTDFEGDPRVKPDIGYDEIWFAVFVPSARRQNANGW